MGCVTTQYPQLQPALRGKGVKGVEEEVEFINEGGREIQSEKGYRRWVQGTQRGTDNQVIGKVEERV